MDEVTESEDAVTGRQPGEETPSTDQPSASGMARWLQRHALWLTIGALVALIAVVAAVLASSGPVTAQSYTTFADLRQAVFDAGVACPDDAPMDPSSHGLGPGTAVGVCGDEGPMLWLYRDGSEEQAGLAWHTGMIERYESTNEYLVGPNWIITTSDATTLQQSMGGRVYEAGDLAPIHGDDKPENTPAQIWQQVTDGACEAGTPHIVARGDGSLSGTCSARDDYHSQIQLKISFMQDTFATCQSTGLPLTVGTNTWQATTFGSTADLLIAGGQLLPLCGV